MQRSHSLPLQTQNTTPSSCITSSNNSRILQQAPWPISTTIPPLLRHSNTKRRQKIYVPMLGTETWLPTAEDVIVQKLR